MSAPERLAPGDTLHEGEEAPPPGVRTMAVVRWVLILALLGAAVYTAGRYFQWWDAGTAVAATYRCPMHPAVVSDRPGTCPICGMDLVAIASAGDAAAAEEKLLPWVCPIHPDYGGDEAGACPVCGEARVKNPRVAPAGLTAVTIDAIRTQQIGVRTARVRKKSLVHHAGYAGVVAIDERGLARVQTRYAGWLETVAVTETGAQVRKGQALATLFSNEVYLAQTEFVHALAAVEGAPSKEMAEVQRSLADAARKRLSLLGLPAADIETLAKTRKAERLVVVRAPASGRVLVRGAIPGAYVQPGSELFTLADLSRVWFITDVPESEAVQVRRGQHAEIRFPAYPTRIFSARASFVYPLADSAARTIKVRFELKNGKGLLRPGMFGRAGLASKAREVLVVPSEAIVDTGELHYAFVARGGGRFEPREVKTSGIHDEDTIVTGGLDEGEEVVTSAGFLIDSESRLRAAAGGMSAAQGGHAGHGNTAATASGDARAPAKAPAPAAPAVDHSKHGGRP